MICLEPTIALSWISHLLSYMDYFGWTLSNRLFTGDKNWLEAMEIGRDKKKGEFEPDKEGWLLIIQKVQKTLEYSGLNVQMGPALHLAPNILPLLINLELDDELRSAVAEYRTKNPIQLSMHARHADDELVNSPRFPSIFADDIEYATKCNVRSLVEHPPIGTENTITETVSILSSDWFCILLEKNPDITLAWENKADYAHKRRFFGSIARMVEFHNTLDDKLHEIGKKHLIKRHQFCFDTGHLLIWRGTAESKNDADKEIEEYLPEFARHIKVYHFQANDGIIDGHVTPFSTKFFDHKSRTRMQLDRMGENFEIIENWIKICNHSPHPNEQHYFLEAGTLPFSLDQYSEFASKLYQILNA